MQNQSENNTIKLIKYFQLVESNSQFFTVVRRSISSDSGKDLKLSTQYIEKNIQAKLDFQNFMQAFIQVAYLIYTARYHELNLQIRPEDVRIQENYNWGSEKKFSFVIFYRFINTPRDNNIYHVIIRDIYTFLEKYHVQYWQKLQDKQVDEGYQLIIRKFHEQFNFICQRINLINDLGQRQRQFYIYLQQTDLFREHSMLLKIKNASILDGIRLKMSKFKISKQRDVNLVNQYNNQKKKIKCDLQQLKKKQKLIQKNIIQFFQEITQKNQRKFKLKIQPDPQNYKTRFIFTIFQLPLQPFQVRLQNSSKNIENDMMQIQNPKNSNNKQKLPYTQYQIQYNSERNSISVRLILSSIVCSTQAADYILFQSNVLSFQSANISLQFAQDKSIQKNTSSVKRNLAFRGSSCFNTKEPILQKILILMDLTMIAAKVYEPELLPMKKNTITDKDPQRLTRIYRKVDHYTKVFLRCAKKVYNQ